MNSKAKIHILIIEDNVADAQKIEQKLERLSLKCIIHKVDALYDGFDKIQNQPIDIALLDLTLPDSNGFKTLTSYLERVPDVPVIVLSETNNEIVGNQSIKAGAQDFLVKNQFEAMTLGRSIRFAIQRFKSQHKLQQKASTLALNEKRYVEAQEMAHVGNWEMDIVNNEMQWTEEVYRIFGFQPNSFKPTLSEYINYIYTEDRGKVEDFFEYAGKDGKLHQLEHRIVIDGHITKHVSIRGKVHFEELSGKLILIGVIQDITERKLNEQLIVEKNFSNRSTKIMQQALSDMSFNVRTPLSSIVNFAYLLKNTPLSPQQHELLNALKVSVDDMSMGMNSLFNFAVLATEELKVEEEDFKIKDFFTSNEKVLQIRTDSTNTSFEFDIAASIPEKISVDPKKLTLIFYNIVNYLTQENEASGKQVNIYSEISTSATKDTNLRLSFERAGLRLPVAQVRDLLASEKLLEVYDPNNSEQGDNAINMAVALKLIKLLGGRLEISNKSNTATAFIVEIPVKVIKSVSMLNIGQPLSELRILLVEDHFLNQIAHKKVLKAWSDFVSVDIAENGLVAVEKHRAHHYDIIIMDIQMPVMDGIEASRKIREQSDVPIIALTANSSKQEQDRCLKVGINNYMSKPFVPQELYDKIMYLVATVGVRSRG